MDAHEPPLGCLAEHFSAALSAVPGRLHFAAHSHHPWPDVTLDAQRQAWTDAAVMLDDKWDHVFASVYPEAAGHLARELRLPGGEGLAFAPNTHSLVLRVLSLLPERPRIVTTDGEFHAFERQARRLEEDGLCTVERVPTEPFDSFPERLVTEARRGADLVFFSQVFFNSGWRVPALDQLVAALPPGPLVVIDGYHGFLATPTDLSAVCSRAFYVAGGYKYAMSGEGVCFLHAPPGVPWRPRDTGWFAAFGALDRGAGSPGAVAYAPGGRAFLGATFDPTGLYRFNAVQRWRARVGLTTAAAEAWVHGLQRRFVEGLRRAGAPGAPGPEALVVPVEDPRRGHFLTFRTPEARPWAARLKRVGVVTDARDDRLRVGFGVYHDEAAVDALVARWTSLSGG
ncbi:MAG: aminotransferase [Deltaproteobacteria bacterium]|nr:aminotransferase [Deltaproteobacteria bacterium]